jgi:hypothetical protein
MTELDVAIVQQYGDAYPGRTSKGTQRMQQSSFYSEVVEFDDPLDGTPRVCFADQVMPHDAGGGTIQVEPMNGHQEEFPLDHRCRRPWVRMRRARFTRMRRIFRRFRHGDPDAE